MSLATLVDVLTKANKENYAVGAFNTNNLETTRAIIDGAEAQDAPVILSTSLGAFNYAGFDNLATLAYKAAQNAAVPVVLHLDHGTDLNLVKKCIDAGYTSVMFDGSHFPFDKNVELTKKAVKMASEKGVSVEGELGTIGGAEDSVASREILLTDPQKAVEFVEKTGIDALAIAIGTSHGAYKFTHAEQQLDIRRLSAIKQATKMPLVLHGASLVPKEIVELGQSFGAVIGGVQGVTESELKRAVKNGVNKVNTDTDLRLAFTAALRQTLMKNPREFDPRKILKPSTQLMQKVVEDRIRLLGSSGKA
ncbi:MAG: class II fructose-1,6-bisphosphate aldolase [Candidatus Micrarchaeota archaeon]|nr:class II fructose-1,6-bisphosphate aldolase [Candidatus Micrarchaeota archaeon]